MTAGLGPGGSYACNNETSAPSGSSGAAAAAAAGAAASGSPLDIEFAATMRRVEAALHGAPRQIRIRGEQWAQRLGLLSCVRQTLFRKDRNLHSELLLKCIEEGCWTEPMDKHPPEGPLPCLPRHVSCALRRQKIERKERAVMGRASSADRVREASGKADLRATSRRNTSVSRSASLADAAVAAVGVRADVEVNTEDPPAFGKSKPLVTVAVPSSAYSALAARVAHLEEQNRQLRRQLGQAQRRSFSPGGLQGGCGGVRQASSTSRGAPSPVRPSLASAGGVADVAAHEVNYLAASSTPQGEPWTRGAPTKRAPSPVHPSLASSGGVADAAADEVNFLASTLKPQGEPWTREDPTRRAPTLSPSLASSGGVADVAADEVNYLTSSLKPQGQGEPWTRGAPTRGAPSPLRPSLASPGGVVDVAKDEVKDLTFFSKPQGHPPIVEVPGVSRRGRSTSPLPQETLHPSQLPSQSPRRLQSPLPQESPRRFQQPAPQRSWPTANGQPPQPPPEGDTEGFLRYLDEFQEYAGSLFSVVPLPPSRTDDFLNMNSQSSGA